MTRGLWAPSVTAPDDEEAALFDLLAAWADYVAQRAGSRDGGDGPAPAAMVSARWRSHCTLGYARRVRMLLGMAGSVLCDEGSEEGQRAEAFVREHLLPFFEGGAD